MAKITLNPYGGQVRGSVGELTFKRYGEQIVVTRKPDMSNVQWSAGQQAGRERFRQAIAHGKQVLADPVQHAEYAARARKLGKPIFSLVLADYYHVVSAQPQAQVRTDNDDGRRRTPYAETLPDNARLR